MWRAKRKRNNKKGMTLTEMMVAIAIIAVLVAIAIPSIISIRRSLQFKKMNDYAKEVFLAAQNTLVERNAAGTLGVLRAKPDGTLPAGAAAVPAAENALFPAEDWSDEYCYTTTGTAAFDLLLPAGSIDETVRSQHILIEYNPYTGNVYAVFYSESYDLNYTNAYRDKTNCRKAMQGYYQGSGLSGQNGLRDLTTPVVDLSTKGQEAILKVSVPIPDNYLASTQTFADAMRVSAKIKGEYFGGEFEITQEEFEATGTKTVVTGNTVEISFVLDSLCNQGSFASIAQNNPNGGGSRNLGNIQSADAFKILPGDNVAITASISFTSLPDALIYSDVTVSGLNPMFGALQKVNVNGADEYELYLENGRHLQNLNALSPKIAVDVKSVYFSDDIYWNETQAYYTNKYDGKTGDADNAANGTYTNSATELPGRGLPYFVPVTSPNLFGSACFYDSGDENLITQIFPFLSGIKNLPLLTDTDSNGKEGAEVFGGKHKVLYLNIDAAATNIQNTNYYAYKDGSNAVIADVGKDRFTGLFSYCESNISSLYVVNSTIAGTSAGGTSATGGMVGACGPYAFLYDCGIYIDTADKYFSRANMDDYGVTGQNAVGGLVGYAKSHKSVAGELMTNDEDVLAFSQCFAAVPVTGTMIGNDDMTKGYGYTNGVGGIVGVSILSNFYNCYASGDVYGTNAYTPGNISQILAIWLDAKGAWSRGVGGFVGTSHGTRYSNCFVTGDVSGSSVNLLDRNANGVGGFIGVAFLDETFNYGSGSNRQTVAQSTLFSSCYCTGVSTVRGIGATENFCGRILRYTEEDELQSVLDEFFSELTQISAGNYYTTGTYKFYLFDTIQLGSYTLSDYIYKDSYYLNQYVDVSEDRNSQSNLCAQVVQYQDLQNLQTYQYNLSEQARTANTDGNSLNQQAKKFMQRKYADYLTGFNSTDWGSADSSTTHPYSLGIGNTYPFSKLNGMDYYGDWPSYLPNLALGYYEEYENSSGARTKGYYLDRDRTSTLKNGVDDDDAYTVVGDGYVILCSGVVDSVQINGRTYGTTILKDPYDLVIGNVKYTAYELKPAAMEAAAKETEGTEEFYSKLEITTRRSGGYGVDGSFTVYFNPRFAVTQVNPNMAEGSNQATQATKPQSAPDQINIRTARQLRELGMAPNYWGEDYHYVQLLDIDAEPYDWDHYITRDLSQDVTFRPIGNGTDNGAYTFDGSYNGSAGYVDSARISNLDIRLEANQYEYGLFGIIGETGSVSSITMEVEKTPVLATPVENMGMVAGVNRGEISDATVVADNGLTVTAPTAGTIDNFGMLVGLNNGSVTGCGLRADKPIRADVAKAMGGFVGVNAAAEGDSAAAPYIGNSTLTINIVENTNTSATGFTGGVIGKLESGMYSTTKMTTVNTVAGQGYVGGFAGFASGAPGSFGTVEITTVSSRGGVAGGVIGSAQNLSLSGTNVTVKGSVTGQSRAGGFAAEITKTGQSATSEIQQCNVTLMGSVSAPAGTAAGFAAVADGAVWDSSVSCSGAKITITGVNAAGFIGDAYLARNCTFSGPTEVVINSETGESTVASGIVEITGTDSAAGFANKITTAQGNVAAPVRMNSADLAASFLKGSNDDLKISAPNAAGFVNAVKEGGVVRENAALGTISGTNAAGFVGSNSGTITACMANVVVDNGTGFASENKGTVESSYVWYTGENVKNSFVSSNTGTVSGCYAAPLGSVSAFAPEGGSFTNCYNVSQEEGESLITGIRNVSFETMAVVNPSALGGKDLGWTYSDVVKKYPYDVELSGDMPYVFPMLLKVPQYGDWKNAPVYAYGVVYYEYCGDALHYQIVDLSNTEKTVEEDLLSRNDLIDNDASLAVTKSGYAVFYHNPAQLTVMQGENSIALESAQDLPKPDGFDNYSFKIISEDAVCVENGSVSASAQTIQITGSNQAFGDNAEINPYFACAIKTVPADPEAPAGGDVQFHIHTPQQLQNVAGFPGESFTVCRNLDMSGFGSFTTIENFSGSMTAANGAVISGVTGGSMFGTVSGRLSGLTLNSFNATGLTTGLEGTLEKLTISDFNTAEGDPYGVSLLGNVSAAGVIQELTLNGFVGTNVAGTMEGSITGLQASDIICTNGMMEKVTGTIAPVSEDQANVIRNFTGNGAVFGTVEGAAIKRTDLVNPYVACHGGTALLIEPPVEPDADAFRPVVGLFADSIANAQIQDCQILAEDGNEGALSVMQLAKQDAAFEVGILAGQLKNSVITNVRIEGISLDVTLIRPSDDPADTEHATVICSDAIGGAAGTADATTRIIDMFVTGKPGTPIALSLNTSAQQNDALTPLSVNLDMGGLVGRNAGSLEGSYVQYQDITANNSIDGLTLIGNYGGIVGRMTGGAMDDCHAGRLDGRNTLTVSANGAAAAGGAVGRDAGAAEYCSYSLSSAAVSITADGDAVGQFVGYVTTGEFASCSGWEANDSHQFLGTIESTSDTLGNGYGDGYYDGGTHSEETVSVKQVDGRYPDFTEADPATALTRYEAMLNNCYFQMSDGAHRQYIDYNSSYYKLTEVSETGLYTGTELTGAYQSASLTMNQIGNLINRWGNTPKAIPGYYVLNNGIYQQAYAWSVNGLWTTYYVGAQDGTSVWSGWSGSCNKLFTFSAENLVSGSKYLILSGGTALTTDGTFETFTGDAAAGFRDLTASPRFVLTATGENQLTLGGQTCTVSGNPSGYTVTVGVAAYTAQVFKLTGPSDPYTTGKFEKQEVDTQTLIVDPVADAAVTDPELVPTELPPATMALTPVQTAPAEPVPAPTEPATEPTEPATEPTEPDTEPTEPAAEPTETVSPASEPEETPSEPDNT